MLLSRKKLVGVAFMIAVASMASLAVYQTYAAVKVPYFPPNSSPGQVYYAVKFTCGVMKPGNPWGIAAGTYSTVINVHNPYFYTLTETVVKKFVLGVPEIVNNQTFPTGTNPAHIRVANLRPDAVMAITCTDILRTLGAASGEGMVMIYTTQIPYCPAPTNCTTLSPVLDVWGVYTTTCVTSSVTQICTAPPNQEIVQVQPSTWQDPAPQG